MRLCARVWRGGGLELLCAAGPVGGLKGLALSDGEGAVDEFAEDGAPARGPVGIPVGPAGGMVGDTEGACMRGLTEDQLARPPRAGNPPPRGATYPRGPAGGIVGLVMSGRAGPLGAVKLRAAEGPVGGALSAAGPRGGDLMGVEFASAADSFGSRTGIGPETPFPCGAAGERAGDSGRDTSSRPRRELGRGDDRTVLAEREGMAEEL